MTNETWRSYLLAEDEERRGVGDVVAAEGAVDGGLVDERIAPLGGQDLPLLFVKADVGVGAVGHQGHHHVQPVVQSHCVKRLGQQTLCRNTGGRPQTSPPTQERAEQVPSGTFGKAGAQEDLLQLHLGLPGHPQRGHVETFVLTEPTLRLLAVNPEQ